MKTINTWQGLELVEVDGRRGVIEPSGEGVRVVEEIDSGFEQALRAEEAAEVTEAAGFAPDEIPAIKEKILNGRRPGASEACFGKIYGSREKAERIAQEAEEALGVRVRIITPGGHPGGNCYWLV